MSYVEDISRANIKIFHGKYDESVPFTHSVEIFNATLQKNPRARVFLDIFDGGHETDLHKAMEWFSSQYKPTEKNKATG
jgi:predicted esterase